MERTNAEFLTATYLRQTGGTGASYVERRKKPNRKAKTAKIDCAWRKLNMKKSAVKNDVVKFVGKLSITNAS